jgi:O-antigen/teichoic acid export membrane protein
MEMNLKNRDMNRSDETSWEHDIKTIAKGAGVVFAGMLVGSVLRYVLQIIVARNLGPGLFGLFVLGLTLFKILGMLSELGLPNGLVRFIAIYSGLKDSPRLKGIIKLSLRSSFLAALVIGFATFLLSRFLAEQIFKEPGLIPVLKLVALLIPFSTLTTMLVFTLQGFKVLQFKIAVREIFEPLFRLVFVLLALMVGWKLLGIFLVYLAASVLACWLGFYFLRRIFPEITDRRVVPVFETRKLFSFSWPLLFIFFFGYLLLWTDTIILALYRSTVEVGIYGAAQRTALLSSMIITAFNSIFAPIAADLYNRQRQSELKTLFQTVTKWTLLITAPVCIAIILFSREILGIFGATFSAGSLPMIILLMAWMIHSSMSSAGLVLTMSGRSKLQLANVTFLLTLNIILNFMLIPELGARGAALATAISIILFDIISVVEVASIMKMTPFRPDFLKVLASGGVMLFLGVVLKEIYPVSLHPIIRAVIGSAVLFSIYGMVILLLGIGKEDRIIFKEFMKRLKKTEGSRL